MERINFALENFKNIQDIIKFIDQKAGAILVIYGFMLTAFIEFSKGLVFINPLILTGKVDIFFSFITFLAGAILLLVLLKQIHCIITGIIKPRLCQNYSSNECSFFYFEHISTLQKPHFINTVSSFTDERILKEILDQVHEVAQILCKKTNKFSSIVMITLQKPL